jgi:hypothetical protein
MPPGKSTYVFHSDKDSSSQASSSIAISSKGGATWYGKARLDLGDRNRANRLMRTFREHKSSRYPLWAAFGVHPFSLGTRLWYLGPRRVPRKGSDQNNTRSLRVPHLNDNSAQLSLKPLLIAMIDRAERYERRAQQAEAAAARVDNPQVAWAYLQIAARWRRMADDQRALDLALANTDVRPNDGPSV